MCIRDRVEREKEPKPVSVVCDFFTGKQSTGEFAKKARAEDIKLETYQCWGTPLVSHEEIKALPILKNGTFELVSKITVKGPGAETCVGREMEEMVTEEGLKLIGDMKNMLVGGDEDATADFEIVCQGEVIKCHRAILAARCY